MYYTIIICDTFLIFKNSVQMIFEVERYITVNQNSTSLFSFLVIDIKFFSVIDEALASLHHAGAISVIRSVPNSLEDAEVESFKLSLMKRFQDLRYDVSS